MNVCSRYPCGWTGAGCIAPNCPRAPHIMPIYTPTPSPRTMPVNIPFSLIGITVVTLDGYGNVTIKVDQPYPQEEKP